MTVGGKQATVARAFACGIALGYALLLWWFDRTQVYGDHFYDHGSLVQTYQVARATFILYFAWLIYAVGAGLVRVAFGATALASFVGVERYPLCFVIGAGVWHVLLLGTGLAGLDTKPVAVGLTLTVMAASVPHLSEALRQAGARMAALHVRISGVAPARVAAILALGAVAATFLLVKGLYPNGGYDYYNHYFHFYRKVVETGSIWPNEVWYHFYYCKGAGLYFLAMLLTDPLAPQLVATAFIACGALIVFAFLERADPGSLLPWIGAILYLALLIYTPGPNENRLHGGWADLEKIHELTAVLFLALVWIVSRIFDHSVATRKPWIAGLHAAIISLALLTLPIVVLVGLYLTFCMIILLALRRWPELLGLLGGAVTAGACLLAIAALNYGLTGLPTDQALVRLWPYFDLMKLQKWGTLFEVMLLHWGMVHAAPLPVWSKIPFLMATYLRLELLWPLVVAALPLIAWRIYASPSRLITACRMDGSLWLALAAFPLAVLVTAILAGAWSFPSSISFYRFSSFAYGPSLCGALLLWHLALGPGAGSVTARAGVVTLAGAMALGGIVALALSVPERVKPAVQIPGQILGNVLALWRGQFSIKEAYQNEQGWPGRLPWGGVYPAMETVWKIIGPGTRVWSFHIHATCMLPDCNVQGVSSFRFSPSWNRVYFGTAQEARDILQAEGLNYFFFSKELRVPAADPLPTSLLFAPNNMKRYLGIRWTDGTSYLLTWSGPGIEPISAQFLDDWRASDVAADPNDFQKTWKPVSDFVNAHRNDLHPFVLPWCANVRCG